MMELFAQTHSICLICQAQRGFLLFLTVNLGIVNADGERPTLELEPSDHPLSIDYYNGISWQKAVEIAEAAMHGDTS